MAEKRTITCTNKDGFSMSFTEKGFSPFLLVDVEGIYSAENNVALSENTMISGATYQGSVAKFKNIVLSLKDIDNFAENRNLINKLFKENSPGILSYTEGETTRDIEYYVENFNSTGEEAPRLTTVSLICPDPFFYDPNDTTVYMSEWLGCFEFEFEDDGEGFEFGYRSPVRIQNIVNEFAEDNIGMTIMLTCTGEVANPTVTRVESDEHISIGTATKPLDLVSGDMVVITTETGNKHVYLTHEGATREINEYLTEDSVFIQLMRGDNHIGYEAESGEDYLTVAITYRLKHARA